MIWLATEEDIPRILRHAEGFFSEGRFIGEYDPAHFEAWLREKMKEPLFWFLVSPNGSAGMVISEIFYSGARVAQELWVYGERGEGRALMRECENIANQLGAAPAVSVQVHKRGETVEKIYERMGYERREIGMVKVA